ncbi:MAG TPA: SdrD B-like domain-containing protein [Miltoncostaeaceae bacterium]|nr:SdrD B-like domain-containing protein [Miltoncostaeaceae bacterium]
MRRMAIGLLGALAAFVTMLLPSGAPPPPPPQAILQSGVEQLSYTVSFDSIPHSHRLSVMDPFGATVFSQTWPLAPSAASPIQNDYGFTPGQYAPVGRYTARAQFFQRPGLGSEASVLETEASAIFDVASALGTIRIVKCEDLNGNGACDPGEPGLPGWRFSLMNPQGNGAAAVTGPDGSVTITNVPAGTWTATEVMEPGWMAITPVTGSVTVPANGVGAYAAANARPAPLCGTVFIDANRNGVFDPGEARVPGATLSLAGPNGAAAQRTSDGNGDYCFAQLPPGTYAVNVTVPSGYENTTPVTRSDIVLRSGIGSYHNDFGLATPRPATPPPPVVTTGRPAPSPTVGITKRAPATAVRNGVFDYTITVRNRSAFVARDVVVSDLVPVHLTLVAIPRGATIRNGVVTWSLGDLPAKATRALTMRVRVNGQFTGVLKNTATVTAAGMTPRRATARTRVVGPPPVVRTGGVTG